MFGKHRFQTIAAWLVSAAMLCSFVPVQQAAAQSGADPAPAAIVQPTSQAEPGTSLASSTVPTATNAVSPTMQAIESLTQTPAASPALTTGPAAPATASAQPQQTKEEPDTPEELADPAPDASSIIEPTMDFTRVAPFLQAVKGPSRLKSLRMAAQAKQQEENGLILNKQVESLGGDNYKVTLEAYTTGKVSGGGTMPADIILVLDQSGSMAYDFNSVDYREISVSNCDNEWMRDNDDALYVKVGGTYCQIYVQRGDWQGNNTNQTRTYTYYYALNGQWVQYDASTDSRTRPSRWDDWSYTYGAVPMPATPTTDGKYYESYEVADSGTRMAALKTAVTSFVNQVAEKSKGADDIAGTADDVAHRIAIVGFASESGYGDNTEILSVAGNNSGSVGVKYNGDGYATACGNALVSALTTGGSVNAVLTNAIAALATNGATRSDLGMDMANDIFAANPLQQGEERQRVVVMFTDGVPTTQSDFHKTVAENAISYARTAKSTAVGGYGATVYTVGIFEGADGTPPAGTWNAANTESKKANRFMHLVSSNYKNASGIDDNEGGSLTAGVDADSSYFLSASNTAALNNIFTKIASQIQTPSISLGAQTVVKDILSPYFNLPEGAQASDITVSTAAAQFDGSGDLSWAAKEALTGAGIDIDDKTVSVSGFNFNENFISETGYGDGNSFHGKKLIIEIPIVWNGTAAFGGNGIPTNGAQSGVYENANATTAVEHFTIPTVNRPLDYAIAAQDQTIHVTQNADLKTLLAYQTGYVPNGTNNAFVDIVYTLKQGETVIGTYTIPAGQRTGTWSGGTGYAPALTDCTDYTLACTVTPNPANAPAGSIGALATAIDVSAAGFAQKLQKMPAVHVLKPVATWQDVRTYLGQSADISGGFVSVQWLDAYSGHTEGAPLQAAPQLTFTYAVDGVYGMLSGQTFTPSRAADAPVQVSATIGATNVDAHVTHVWNACYPACDQTIAPHKGDAISPEFYVHVDSCTLTIQKTGINGVLQNGTQTSLFTVTGPNGLTFDVAVQNNGSRTIVGLPVGAYKVAEHAGWSWRYGRVQDQSKTLSIAAPNGIVSVQNVPQTDKWLSGDNFATNVFDAMTQIR